MKDLLKLLKAERDELQTMFKDKFLIQIKGAERAFLIITPDFKFIIIHKPIQMSIYFTHYRIDKNKDITLLQNDIIVAYIKYEKQEKTNRGR